MLFRNSKGGRFGRCFFHLDVLTCRLDQVHKRLGKNQIGHAICQAMLPELSVRRCELA